ncbi:MAG TPA: HAMP domain-containing sensor histidine kinase [Actinomycetes bacterium]|nr:HAMP domain-containing sensor histidine kinase [Actinomycetes bacterium]
MTPALSSYVTGIRARVVLWYLGLLALALIVAVLALRQFLLVSLDESVDASLQQEAEEMSLFVTSTDPRTGEPYDEDLKRIFTDFVAGDVPEVAEGSLFLINGRPYRADRGADAGLLDDQALVDRWASLTEPTFGNVETELGPARWLAVPITADGEVAGTFITTHFTALELNDINQAVRLMAVTTGGMLLVVSVVGWLTVGNAVAPIRRLTRTARNISDSHLSERIPVTGNDEVAELTRTFNSMLDRIENAFADQRTFLDDIGHELRTPLTIVRGNLELLPDDPVERQQTLALCLDELDRMNRYVNELILLAKAEKPDFLQVAPVDLTELTEGIRSRASSLSSERVWQVDVAAPAIIEADPERLTQAWLNLVTNAVQHTEAGGVIGLGSSVVDDEARLWVRDDGPGVPLEEQEHIFERFGRGRDKTAHRRDGTGLGLAIVSAIARAHGGRVRIDSRPGHGARFTIIVPVRPPDVDEDELDDETQDTMEIREKVIAQ